MIEHLKQNQIVAAVANVVQRIDNVCLLVEHVAKENQQRAFGESIGDFVQAGRQFRLARGTRLGEGREDVRQVRAFTSRREVMTQFLVEREQSHRVLLANAKVTQRSCQTDRIIHLRHAAAGSIVHTPRTIDEKIRLEVRLRLELLDVVSIRLAINPPIYQAKIVAGGILAVLRELDREAMKWRTVQPRQKPLHDKAGLEVQPLNLLDHVRLQVLFRGKRHGSFVLRHVSIRNPQSQIRHGVSRRPPGRDRSGVGLSGRR